MSHNGCLRATEPRKPVPVVAALTKNLEASERRSMMQSQARVGDLSSPTQCSKAEEHGV